MKYAIPAIVVWAAWYMLTVGAIFATTQANFPWRAEGHGCREDLAFAAGWSLLPPALVIAPFVTGFYQDGFRWSCPPVAR